MDCHQHSQEMYWWSTVVLRLYKFTCPVPWWHMASRASWLCSWVCLLWFRVDIPYSLQSTTADKHKDSPRHNTITIHLHYLLQETFLVIMVWRRKRNPNSTHGKRRNQHTCLTNIMWGALEKVSWLLSQPKDNKHLSFPPPIPLLLHTQLKKLLV